ncbi:signal peptidase II [Macrococcus caseolyticus]|uniref:signal peptidase II n=1 Tax=Macrococcoides caseolyticum TaxID=69966 RepID=UPI0024BC0C0B|nr:signal peptidase II [Macrococcus caseolyticus]MDJ1154301.1 signal peptidase II [Macrococcus caseolyticus]MDJ1155573.1 signal peptidase II [Macrococcus caseolyticus]MEB8171014.1 signal peptidase II [Macrococcus caseolyticus]
MNRKYRIMPMTLYAAILILIDQISKNIIVKTMNIGESISVIGEVLQITSHRNYGAAWGMLQNQMIFFYIITIIVLIALIYFYYKEAADNLLMQCGLMLIFAGAVGNFIDRLFRGNVVDFIDTKIISYDFPIFNVADSCLTIGVFILLYELLFNQKEEKSHGNI